MKTSTSTVKKAVRRSAPLRHVPVAPNHPLTPWENEQRRVRSSCHEKPEILMRAGYDAWTQGNHAEAADLLLSSGLNWTQTNPINAALRYLEAGFLLWHHLKRPAEAVPALMTAHELLIPNPYWLEEARLAFEHAALAMLEINRLSEAHPMLTTVVERLEIWLPPYATYNFLRADPHYVRKIGLWPSRNLFLWSEMSLDLRARLLVALARCESAAGRPKVAMNLFQRAIGEAAAEDWLGAIRILVIAIPYLDAEEAERRIESAIRNLEEKDFLLRERVDLDLGSSIAIDLFNLVADRPSPERVQRKLRVIRRIVRLIERRRDLFGRVDNLALLRASEIWAVTAIEAKSRADRDAILEHAECLHRIADKLNPEIMTSFLVAVLIILYRAHRHREVLRWSERLQAIAAKIPTLPKSLEIPLQLSRICEISALMNLVRPNSSGERCLPLLPADIAGQPSDEVSPFLARFRRPGLKRVQILQAAKLT